MADEYTEYSHEGFGSRIANSFKGVIFGSLLFLASFLLLAWNEKRAVTEIRSLEEARKLVVGVQATDASTALEGKLVFTSGLASTTDTLQDALFHVSQNALKLRRKVQMYQWDEDKHTEKSGGDRKTTYTYKREWSEKLISSSDFHHESGHENPNRMPFSSDEQVSDNVLVGARRLSPALMSYIRSYTELPASSDSVKVAPAVPGKTAKLEAPELYYGRDSSAPEVGDLRVRFEFVKPLNVSLIARQTGNSFSAFQTQAGNSIELLEEGIHDSNYVLDAALKRNAVLSWILRAVGWLLMFIGIALFLGPLAALTEWIPLLGSVVGLGIGLAAFVLASILSLLTIAITWIAVRPLAGGITLALALILLWGAKKRGEKKLESSNVQSRSATPPPPPPTQLKV